MNTISINGKSFTTKGNVTIIDGVIYSDGKILDAPEGKEINITIEGNVENLDIDSCSKINVTGDVGRVETISGNVECGNVYGNVKTTSGSVKCGDVTGDIKTMSGSVKANEISGNVKTMSGSISH